MRLHQSITTDVNLITACSGERILVNNQPYMSSLIVTRETITTDWRPTALTELEDHDLDLVVALDPEVVLLGTGDHMAFPHPRVLAPLINNNIGVEVMDTQAACRTYNILAAEGRQVAAALILEVAAPGLQPS